MPTCKSEPPSRYTSAPTRLELWAWAMYDFANSGYTTVVLTTVFNVYFVSVIAAPIEQQDQSNALLLWTIAIGIANALVLAGSPVIGAIADQYAIKKRLLVVTTAGCVVTTGLLALTGAGDIVLAMVLLILSNMMFAYGENLIAAFLPELSDSSRMGKISGYAWGLGYFGGMLVLGIALAYISWAKGAGLAATEFIPTTMILVAVIFTLASLPTFIWLQERAVPSIQASQSISIRACLLAGWQQVQQTLHEARRFHDLFRFLISLTLYQCGVSTVVTIAAIYASEVMAFTQQEIIILILVVNITASLGAISFGVLQDYWGSVRTLSATLLLWMLSVVTVYLAETATEIWIAGNLIGLAMGSSQSAGRALVGQFTPSTQTAEFFGLWGLAGKLAAIIGPISYGTIHHWSTGNHRLALLATMLFFIAGLIILLTVDEQKGRQAAQTQSSTRL